MSNNPKGTSVISPNWRVSKCRPRGQEKINRVAPSATTCHISRNEHVRRVLRVLESPASIFSGCQYSTGTFCQSQRRRRFCRSKKPVMGSDPTRNNKDSWVMETGTLDNVHEDFQDLNKNISSISAYVGHFHVKMNLEIWNGPFMAPCPKSLCAPEAKK